MHATMECSLLMGVGIDSRSNMSVKMKQRFGEALALALIVTIIGFIVYMMFPSVPKTPKSSPVIVRSAISVEHQPHVASITVQTPSSGQVLQGAAVAVTNQSPVSGAASYNNNGNVGLRANEDVNKQQNGNAIGAIVTATETKASCMPLPQTVSKIKSLLKVIPVIGSLISHAANCSS